MGEILNNVRAQVLVDALPYIQKYNNKILEMCIRDSFKHFVK